MGQMVVNGEKFAGSNLDLKNNIVTFDSQDEEEPAEYTEMPLLESRKPFKNVFKTLSILAKNVRWLKKNVGNNDVVNVDINAKSGVSLNYFATLDGKTLIMSLNGNVAASNVYNKYYEIATVNYHPYGDIYCPVIVWSGSSNGVGIITVNSSGSIQLYSFLNSTSNIVFGSLCVYAISNN